MVSALTLSSSSLFSSQKHVTKPGSPLSALIRSSYESTCTVFSLRKFFDDSSKLLCILSKVSETLVSTSSKFILNFPSTPSLLEKTTVLFSTSLGPISILNGTPFNSHSLNLNPGDILSLSST